MKLRFNNQRARVILAPCDPELQQLGCEVVDRLVQAGMSSVLSDARVVLARDVLRERALLVLLRAGAVAESELERLVCDWQPLFFTTWSPSPLASLDFALFTFGDQSKTASWLRSVTGFLSVLTYYGAREITPAKYAVSATSRDVNPWLNHVLSAVGAHHPMAAE